MPTYYDTLFQDNLARRPVPTLLPAQLREAIVHEVFDYQALLTLLSAYASPRDKITDLLEKGIIIRLKKGLYVFGQLYRRRPVSREVVANLLFGPSYISLEYALQYHGLIPEGVETVTSVTTGRSRRFITPIGSFTYRKIPLRAFRIGMDLVETGQGVSSFIATPEKALADKLVAERGSGINDLSAMREFLLSNLRIPAGEIMRLDAGRLREIAAAYRSQRVALLARLIEKEPERKGGRD